MILGSVHLSEFLFRLRMCAHNAVFCSVPRVLVSLLRVRRRRRHPALKSLHSWTNVFASCTFLAWKITKAVDIKVVPSSGALGYWIEVHDKHVLSEEEMKTQEYDKKAFKIVSYGTIPLLVGYTIYSLLYEVHRGWYSFVISTLTSFVYMFGFVQLIRQCASTTLI